MSPNIKQRQLKLLLNDFDLLSKTVLTQIQITGKLIENRNIDSLYDEAKSNEIIIDRLEIKVREEVVFTILQFNPIAAELRMIATYLEITTNLERVGDMLLNIINYVREFDFNPYLEEKKHIQKMLKEVGEMTHNSISSFMNEDIALAYKTIKDDDIVDDLFHQLNRDLGKSFSGRQLTEKEIEMIIALSRIGHNLERIGDSATNIAESTIYLTEGKDIRHGNEKN